MKLSLKYRVLAAGVIAILGFALLLFSFSTDTFKTAKAKRPGKIAVLNLANYQDHVSLSWQPLTQNVVGYQIEMKTQDGTWECVEEIERAEWRDLGMPETLWNCRVKEFGPLIVSIDAEGRNYFEEKKIEYNERKEEQIAKISAQVGFIK